MYLQSGYCISKIAIYLISSFIAFLNGLPIRHLCAEFNSEVPIGRDLV